MAEQKAKVVKVGRGGPRGPRPKVQNPGKIFMRILRYVNVTAFRSLRSSSAFLSACLPTCRALCSCRP
jgi:hypothetical protein